jgi:hypothetical protein
MISQIFKFHAKTFLEQDEGDSRLKFREPSYNTFCPRVTSGLSSSTGNSSKEEIIEITSMVVSWIIARPVEQRW